MGQQLPSAQTDPDDRKTYGSGSMFATIVGFFASIWRYPLKILDNQFSLVDQADTTKVAQFDASVITTGTTRTFVFPDATTNLVGDATVQTIQNKTLNNTNAITVKDASFFIQDDGDTTKQVRLQASGITTATTRVYTFPDADGTLALTDDLPWTIQFNVYTSLDTATNWATLTNDTAVVYAFTRDSTGAQNALVTWNNIYLAAGSWTASLMHQQGADRGQYQLQLDGTNATGWTVIEGYAAATARNVRTTQTFTVATSKKYSVTLIMATKNAASANYVGSIQFLHFKRTA